MKTSFEFIENEDIVYYAHIKEELTMVDYNSSTMFKKYSSHSTMFKKYYPLIGQFKIVDLKHIKEYTRDISEKWSLEPEYKTFSCNRISFNIEPIDEEAKEIMKSQLEYNSSLYSFNKPIVMDFTNVTELVKNTDGRGTCHNLWITKNDAILDCMDYINRRLTTDYQVDRIIETKEHNETELEKLKLMYDENI